MRSVNRQVSFADLELEKQGVAMEPVLQTISNLLDDNREIIEKIGADLRRGLKNPDTGRNGLTPRAVQRSLHELDRLQCSDAANSEAISGVGDILGTIEAQNVGRE